MELQPGDLCVIIDHPQISSFDKCHIGKVVVLLNSRNYDNLLSWNPFWRVSGVEGVEAISQEILRKIPPDELAKDRITEEELVV
jgi:hypothetical protein